MKTDYTEEELDALVEKIKEPLRPLDTKTGEMVMTFAYFEVMDMIAALHGWSDEQIKEHVLGSFDAYRAGSPKPKPIQQH